jgi:hypothetical protein
MKVEIDPQKEAETWAVVYMLNADANPEVGMGPSVAMAVSDALRGLSKKYGRTFPMYVNRRLAEKNVRDLIAGKVRGYPRRDETY